MSDGRSYPHPCEILNTYKLDEVRIGRSVF